MRIVFIFLIFKIIILFQASRLQCPYSPTNPPRVRCRSIDGNHRVREPDQRVHGFHIGG